MIHLAFNDTGAYTNCAAVATASVLGLKTVSQFYELVPELRYVEARGTEYTTFFAALDKRDDMQFEVFPILGGSLADLRRVSNMALADMKSCKTADQPVAMLAYPGHAVCSIFFEEHDAWTIADPQTNNSQSATAYYHTVYTTDGPFKGHGAFMMWCTRRPTVAISKLSPANTKSELKEFLFDGISPPTKEHKFHDSQLQVRNGLLHATIFNLLGHELDITTDANGCLHMKTLFNVVIPQLKLKGFAMHIRPMEKSRSDAETSADSLMARSKRKGEVEPAFLLCLPTPSTGYFIYQMAATAPSRRWSYHHHEHKGKPPQEVLPAVVDTAFLKMGISAAFLIYWTK